MKLKNLPSNNPRTELPSRHFRKLLHTLSSVIRSVGGLGTRRNAPVPDATSAGLHVATAFHGFEHGDFVGVFDIAANRDSHRDAGHFHSGAFELLREIDCR